MICILFSDNKSESIVSHNFCRTYPTLTDITVLYIYVCIYETNIYYIMENAIQ